MEFMDPTHILLVEDDPNDVELIQIALDSYNFVNKIDVAADGEQAVHYLFGRNGQPPTQPLPRLVLLDLKLPKIDGIQVLEMIRSNPLTRNLVVVVMTSSAENRDLKACYDLGVNSYIVKPLDFQQFVEMSRQVGFYWMMLNQLPSNN
ncbi:response regulator [Pseudanabaena yagii GIHE-NHR1]|uniref:Response regulator n=2 Tax=Pseudanabaena TaxID=1152 RepID=A0ABX1LRK3_9CYAN|nr:response regulator [Pseudanabaena yagii GIHE-NHR1]